jgi:hypothetical protein
MVVVKRGDSVEATVSRRERERERERERKESVCV